MCVVYNCHAEQNPSSQKGDIDSSPTFQSDSVQDVRIASHDATVHTHTEFHHGHFHAEVRTPCTSSSESLCGIYDV